MHWDSWSRVPVGTPRHPLHLRHQLPAASSTRGSHRAGRAQGRYGRPGMVSYPRWRLLQLRSLLRPRLNGSPTCSSGTETPSTRSSQG